MAYLTRRGFLITAGALASFAIPSTRGGFAWADGGTSKLKAASGTPPYEGFHEIAKARDAFARGDYAQALMVLDNAGDVLKIIQGSQNEALVHSLVLRAEIMSTQIILGLTANSYEYAIQARGFAKKAVMLNPDLAEANMQYAIATGLQARSAGMVTAWRKKLPQQSLEAIERASRLGLTDPRIDALFGAWHLEIVRRAGTRRAASIYEASLEAGMVRYEAALVAAPHDIIITANYGFSLLAINQVQFTSKVEALFSDIKENAPQSAMEGAILERVIAVLNVMDQPRELRAVIGKIMTT